MRLADIAHGTYGGAQQCCKRPEGSCDDCKAARAAYIRQYRADHPNGHAIEKAKNRAMVRALWVLSRRHPTEFRTLFDAEWGKE